MRRARVRLKDIADRTGFSINTVSLALRESPRIPAETRKVIRAAADSLNYLPNQIAKSLVKRETRTVGLVLTNILNPTLTQTAQTLERMLADRGYSILFATSNNTVEQEDAVIDMFRSRQVDGMLVYPTRHCRLDRVRALRQAGYPIVLLVALPDAAGVDAVSVDDRSGAYKATRHLLELGHSRIGFLDSAHPLGNNEKRDGHLQALAEFGVARDDALICDPKGHGAGQGFDAMYRLMASAEPPTAVFAANDSLAIGALRWCQKHGLDVPADLSVVGFDNIELAQFTAVSLTTINYAVQRLSRMAIDRLLALIEAGDSLPPPRVTLLDPELVVRESSGPPR
ncbi:MAG: LacI family DNA-binding transcriptional regulator [Alphaproteobacteria bacterium]